MDIAIPLPGAARRMPLRSALLVALLIAALVAATAFIVGSQQRVPLPFGPAANGQLAYVSDGDIFVRDTFTGEGRLLIGGDRTQFSPYFSPDGTRLAWASDVVGSDPFYVANADGSDPVQVALIQPAGNAQAYWAPDSRRMAFIYEIDAVPTLSIATVDGASTVIDLGGLKPWNAAWLPPDGDRLLLRAEDPAGGVELFTVRSDGTELTALGLHTVEGFGAEYALSGFSVSPDGTTIAYNGIDHVPGQDIASEHFRLHLVAIDGSNDRALAGPVDPKVQENWPVFSPDGQWIVAQRWTFEDMFGGLVIMPADGSEVAREIGPRGIGGNLSKVWSPDSSRILMLLNDSDPAQVYSIDPISGDYELLPWADDIPDWQRAALP